MHGSTIYNSQDMEEANVSGPRDYHIKWGNLEKDKYHMMSLTGGI